MSRYNGRVPTDYESAKRMLGNKTKRTILNNTTLHAVGDEFFRAVQLRYHGNNIAVFCEDGTTNVWSAGYGGSTFTKERLNAITRGWASWYSRDFHPYVLIEGTEYSGHDSLAVRDADGSVRRLPLR